MMEKLIITAAICGAEVTKGNSPAAPYTVEGMVRETKSAYDTDAAVIHVHVRWDDGTPAQGWRRFRVVLDAIKATCPGVILIPSTGGVTGVTPEERLQPAELFPEIATLGCDACNLGNDIFVSDMPTIRAFGQRMVESHIKPEHEYPEIGHLDTILSTVKKGLVPDAPVQFSFVLGVSDCTPATMGGLNYSVRQIPSGSTRIVTGIGRSVWDATAAGIVMDGNVRVGFGDNIRLGKGHKTASNDELVAKVVRLSKELGRKTTNPGEARRILSLV